MDQSNQEHSPSPYTSIPHDDGIAATASGLNTNCQFPHAILQLIRFILEHNVFTFDNQFFIQTYSFLDTRISIKNRHLCTSLYCNPTDNITMLHFSRFHPKHIKEAIPYGQALRIHRNCLDEEECDGHLKSKLPSLQDNINYNTTQPCHGNVCKTCQIISMDTTITRMVYWRNHVDATTMDEWTLRNNRQSGMFRTSQGTLQQSRTFIFRSS
eukprot:g32877.t1